MVLLCSWYWNAVRSKELAIALSVHSPLGRHVRQNAIAFASRSLFSVRGGAQFGLRQRVATRPLTNLILKQIVERPSRRIRARRHSGLSLLLHSHTDRIE